MSDIPPHITRRVVGMATLLTTILGRELAAQPAAKNAARNSSGARMQDDPIASDSVDGSQARLSDETRRG